MSAIHYAIDSPHTNKWAERVGKLILNFSGLEFETYLWLVNMSEDASPRSMKKFANRTFADRVT